MMRLTVKAAGLAGTLIGLGCSGEFDSVEEPEGTSVAQAPIEGGQVVTSGQASVRVKLGIDSWCSGAIIGPRTFVTAAHCATSVGFGDKTTTARVEYYDQSSWWCLTESANTNARCSASRSAKAWVNPTWEDQPYSENDFAVVSMDRDFSYIRAAHHMMIMKAPTKAAIGNFNTVGYGANEDGDATYTDPPLLARFTVNNMWSTSFSSKAGVLSGVTGDTGMRLCRGDSGAPQWEPLAGSNTRLLFGLHTGRSPRGQGDCGDYETLQTGPVVGQFMSQIESHLGRTCRHINYAAYGGVADCWP